MEPDESSLPSLELSFQGRMLEMVETLVQWQAISIADVVRKAVTHEYFLQDTMRRGGKILVETQDKTLHTVHFP